MRRTEGGKDSRRSGLRFRTRNNLVSGLCLFGPRGGRDAVNVEAVLPRQTLFCASNLDDYGVGGGFTFLDCCGHRRQ